MSVRDGWELVRSCQLTLPCLPHPIRLASPRFASPRRLVLDLEQLRYTIALALDDIGCRESYCEVGYEHVNFKKHAAEAAAAAAAAAPAAAAPAAAAAAPPLPQAPKPKPPAAAAPKPKAPPKKDAAPPAAADAAEWWG